MSDEDFQTGSTNVFEFWPGTRYQSLPQVPPSMNMLKYFGQNDTGTV